MWSYNNKIPKIHRVSQNETDDLVIEHTEGEFKINVKDIVNVKRKSDIHSIKSDPSYGGFLNVRDDQKSLISLRDIIAIYFSAGFRFWPMNFFPYYPYM